jgi:hypothetical protein
LALKKGSVMKNISRSFSKNINALARTVLVCAGGVFIFRRVVAVHILYADKKDVFPRLFYDGANRK